jgi:hypothetical protein
MKKVKCLHQASDNYRTNFFIEDLRILGCYAGYQHVEGLEALGLDCLTLEMKAL